jgi:hypothetical protein
LFAIGSHTEDPPISPFCGAALDFGSEHLFTGKHHPSKAVSMQAVRLSGVTLQRGLKTKEGTN